MQKQFMSEAIRLATEQVQKGGGPFGAVIVKDGKIIAKGANKVTLAHDPTAHAEVVAIREACEKLGTHNLEGCDIYCSCEPCPMCLGAIYWARIGKVFFAATKADAREAGFDDQMIYEELCKSHEERVLFTEQMMRDDALEAFRKWKDNPDRIEY